MNLSDFLTQDNLVFILILLGGVSVFVVIFFIIIRAIIRLIKALIKKILKRREEAHSMEGALTDKGEDISLQVEELEKSRRETAMAQDKEQMMPSVKTPPLQYYHPISSANKEIKTEEQKEKEKEQKEIEAGLEELKHPGEGKEKKSFLEQQAEARHGGGEFMSKIKIPVSKKVKLKEHAAEPEEQKPEDKTVEPEKTPEKTEQKTKPEPKIKPKAKEAPSVEEPALKEAKEEPIKKEEERRGQRALGDDLAQARELPVKEIKESPISRAGAEQKEKQEPSEQRKPSKVRQIQQGLQNFAGRIFGKKEDKSNGAKKESISIYERPDIIKDKLAPGEKKEKEKEKPASAIGFSEVGDKEEIEAGLEELKHPEKILEKKSFLKEQTEADLRDKFGDIPVPPKIEIPTLNESPLKRAQTQQGFSQQSEVFSSKQQPSVYQEPKKQAESNLEEQEIPLYEKPEFMKDELGIGARQKARREQAVGTSPEFMKDELGIGSGNKTAKQDKGSALFGNREEISRMELRRKLRRDSDIWKAQRDVRLNLKPGERVKLEKEFFSKIYGRNISKSDVKKNLRRMGKEWASASNMQRKETLRRQIKFLKNISGIKNPYK